MNPSGQEESRSTGGPGTLRRMVSEYPATSFLILTYVAQTAITATQYFGIRNYGLSAIRIFLPAVWAVGVTALAFGKTEAKKLLSSLTIWRVPPFYYCFALFYPTVIGFLSLGFLRLIGVNKHIEIDLPTVSTWSFFQVNVSASVTEEIAWVGFLLALLARRFRLFTAAAITGTFWGVAYIPLVFAEIQVPPGFPIIPLIFNFMVIAAICAWLYERTHSALLVFIMQLTTAYTGQAIPVLPLRGGETQYIAFVIVKCLFAFLLFAVWGPRPLFGPAGPRREALEAVRPASNAGS